jgi:hypothetical protein
MAPSGRLPPPVGVLDLLGGKYIADAGSDCRLVGVRGKVSVDALEDILTDKFEVKGMWVLRRVVFLFWW